MQRGPDAARPHGNRGKLNARASLLAHSTEDAAPYSGPSHFLIATLGAHVPTVVSATRA